MTPTNPSDDPTPDDPDLIAYLDGELDADESRTVETQLAGDAETRVKAEEYKKTYDLLDYLPKPEPSESFTARTLTKLQPVLAPSPTGSAPSLSTSGTLPAPRAKLGPEFLLWAVALVAIGGAGYFGHLLAQPYLNPPREAEKFDQADLPLIHDLPLYTGVDDLEFLRRLQEADLFDDGPTTTEASQKLQRDKISLAEQQKLIAQFQGYPSARRQQLRTLHKQLEEMPAKEGAALRRSLEAYAVWLDRLPDGPRKEILTAANGADRFEAVLRVRERLWRESLPPSQQKALKTVATVEERTQYLRELRQREETFRREWELTHRQWQPNKSEDQKAWPFNNPALAKSLDEFIRKSFGIDPNLPIDKKGELPAPCRLTREELLELKYRHDAAQKEGYWFSYGACLLQLAEQHPMLPEPGKGKPLTHFEQPPLTPQVMRRLIKNDAPLPQRFRTTLGRWPDFALEIHKLDANTKDKDKLPPLGPCRPAGRISRRSRTVLEGTVDAEVGQERARPPRGPSGQVARIPAADDRVGQREEPERARCDATRGTEALERVLPVVRREEVIHSSSGRLSSVDSADSHFS